MIPWIYSYDKTQLHQRMQGMTAFYEQRRQQVLGGELIVELASLGDAPDRIKWSRGLRYRLQRQEILSLKHNSFRLGMYRPFDKQHVYFDSQYVEVVSRTPALFPTPDAINQVIGVTGRGESTEFSTLISASIPNFHLIAGAQWLPRYRYETLDSTAPDAWVRTNEGDSGHVPGYRRIDNITDWCLQQFRERFPALHITKEDIWHYVYGLLHAPGLPQAVPGGPVQGFAPHPLRP